MGKPAISAVGDYRLTRPWARHRRRRSDGRKSCLRTRSAAPQNPTSAGRFKGSSIVTRTITASGCCAVNRLDVSIPSMPCIRTSSSTRSGFSSSATASACSPDEASPIRTKSGAAASTTSRAACLKTNWSSTIITPTGGRPSCMLARCITLHGGGAAPPAGPALPASSPAPPPPAGGAPPPGGGGPPPGGPPRRTSSRLRVLVRAVRHQPVHDQRVERDERERPQRLCREEQELRDHVQA